MREKDWSKSKEEKNMGPEEDEAARPAASARKLRSKDLLELPVATPYHLGSDSDLSANDVRG